MRLKVLGAASIAAITLIACAKKDETATADATAPTEETTAADATDETVADADVAADATDVYAAPPAFDLATVRTKDALTAAADAAFAQADADADGSLSQTEFYSLAAMMAPAAEQMADSAADAVEGAVDETVDGVVDETAPADSSLDASYATLAGADASLTVDDLRSALLARFEAADTNLDGALDDAEAASFHVAELF